MDLTRLKITLLNHKVARCKTAGPLSVLSDDVAAVANLQGAEGAGGLESTESTPMTRYGTEC